MDLFLVFKSQQKVKIFSYFYFASWFPSSSATDKSITFQSVNPAFHDVLAVAFARGTVRLRGVCGRH